MSRASSHAKALKTQSDSDPHSLTREPLGSQGVIPQPPQQKPKVDMGLPGKYLGMSFMSKGMNLCDIHGRPTRFLRILCQLKHCQLGLKETVWMPRAETVWLKTAQIQAYATFHEKGRIIQKVEPWAKRAEPQTTGLFSDLKHKGVYFTWQDFQIDWKWWLLFPSIFLPFWSRISVTYPMPVPSYFRSRWCVSLVSLAHKWRWSVSEWIRFRGSALPNLDDGVWDCWAE